MDEFEIKSSSSDLVLICSNLKNDELQVRLESHSIRAELKVSANNPYTCEFYDLADFLECISSKNPPWEKSIEWTSLEGEFKLSATCSALGQVIFVVTLSNQFSSEEWCIETQLKYELGQLPELAKSARNFFKKTAPVGSCL